MTKEKLLELLGVENGYGEVVKRVAVKPTKEETRYDNCAAKLTPLEEYNVENHPVFDKSKRRDAERKNGKGEAQTPRPVNRIGLALEKLITGRAAAFLCANPIKYNAAPDGDAEEKMWEAFKIVNEGNKLDYKNQSILERRMSETQVCEIWYLKDIEEDDDFWAGSDIKAKLKPRIFIASPGLKDELYPVFDGQDSLVAFGRKYIEIDDDGKEITHFDLYTDESIYEGVQSGNSWDVEKQPNELKKLPVIYHSQEDVEWALVRSIIRRLEDLFSNFGDSNDKTAYPILALMGEVKDLPQGVADKAIKFGAGSDGKYLVPPNAPEAVKTEIENLLKALHVLTDTVDINPSSLQGIGQTSGVALELLFMPAHLKASKHAGTFGESIQRRINLIKKMIVKVEPSLKAGMSLVIKPQFDFFLPKDVTEIIGYLSTAVGVDKSILSQESAVNILQGVLGGDGKAELEKIRDEKEEVDNSPEGLDKQFKVA